MKTICGVQLKDRKRTKDLMLGLKETIDQLAIANSARWYDHVEGERSSLEKGIRP